MQSLRTLTKDIRQTRSRERIDLQARTKGECIKLRRMLLHASVLPLGLEHAAQPKGKQKFRIN